MNDKQKARWEEVRHSMGLAICCLVDVDRECDRCATDKGCPDTWSDVAEMVDKILNLKDSKGYLVEVADPDQGVIDNETWHKVDREYEAYCAGQNTMAGRIKIIPREG